ncbi:hypothetical protein NQZ68_034928 [Dissostichus eleginoides]|nr:hypothetical protein NQZ68_034928 [Dissostichus eleginoides]
MRLDEGIVFYSAPLTGEVMSDLPGELRNESPDSADVLQRSGNVFQSWSGGLKPGILGDEKESRLDQESGEARRNTAGGKVAGRGRQRSRRALQGCDCTGSGTTFGAHDQLMEKVKKDVKDQFDLVQSNSDDYDVTIVFCPIVSCMGPDVESALRDVKGDKPVILVLLHHAYEAKFIPIVQPGRDGANIKLQVNVFFHETKHGLLNCEENRAAVCEIKKKLLDFPI